MREVINQATVQFLSRSANEAFGRTAAACFAAQLDPTLDELNDLKTAVSEAVTNAVVHAYPDRLGKVSMTMKLFADNTVEIAVRDRGVGIADTGQARVPLYTTGGERAGGDGLHHYGELHRRAAPALCPGKRHRCGAAQAVFAPVGGCPVSVADTPDLLRAAREGDNEACTRILEENAGLIWSVVRRYYGRGAEPEDLYQLGCLGFLKAVRGFDRSYGTQFSTYAVPKIAGEIRRFLRDDGLIKVSRGMKERSASIYTARVRLESALGRQPTLTELAAETGLEPEDIAAAETATGPVASLQMETAEGFTLESVLGAPGPEENTVERLALRTAIDSLPEREGQVILLRFYKNLTQERTARVLGVSQVQVSRIERRAVEHLRRKLE